MIRVGFVIVGIIPEDRFSSTTTVTNLGGNMARFTQFPLMITRSTNYL